MFDGKVPTTRSYRRPMSTAREREEQAKMKSSSQLLEQSRKHREDRAAEKARNTAATLLQSVFRSFKARKAHFTSMRAAFDSGVANVVKLKTLFASKGASFAVPVSVLLPLLRNFFAFYKHTTACTSRNNNANEDDEPRLLSALQLYHDSSTGTYSKDTNMWAAACASEGARGQFVQSASASASASAGSWRVLLQKIFSLSLYAAATEAAETTATAATDNNTSFGVSKAQLCANVLGKLTTNTAQGGSDEGGLVTLLSAGIAPQLCSYLRSILILEQDRKHNTLRDNTLASSVDSVFDMEVEIDGAPTTGAAETDTINHSMIHIATSIIQAVLEPQAQAQSQINTQAAAAAAVIVRNAAVQSLLTLPRLGDYCALARYAKLLPLLGKLLGHSLFTRVSGNTDARTGTGYSANAGYISGSTDNLSPGEHLIVLSNILHLAPIVAAGGSSGDSAGAKTIRSGATPAAMASWTQSLSELLLQPYVDCSSEASAFSVGKNGNRTNVGLSGSGAYALPLVSLLHDAHVGVGVEEAEDDYPAETMLEDFIVSHYSTGTGTGGSSSVSGVSNPGAGANSLHVDVFAALELRLALVMDQIRRFPSSSSISSSSSSNALTQAQIAQQAAHRQSQRQYVHESFLYILDEIVDFKHLNLLLHSITANSGAGAGAGADSSGGRSALATLAGYGRLLTASPAALLTKHINSTHSTNSSTKTNRNVAASILNVVAFGGSGGTQSLVQRIWTYLTATFGVDRMHSSLCSDESAYVSAAYGGSAEAAAQEQQQLTLCLYLFFASLSHQLVTTDDEEYFEGNKVLTIPDTLAVIRLLKAVLYRYFRGTPATSTTPNAGIGMDIRSEKAALEQYLVKTRLHQITLVLFNQFYNLNERRPFVVASRTNIATPSSTDMETDTDATAAVAAEIAMEKEAAAVWLWPGILPADMELVPHADSVDGTIFAILGGTHNTSSGNGAISGEIFNAVHTTQTESGPSSPDNTSSNSSGNNNREMSAYSGRCAVNVCAGYSWVELQKQGPLANARLWSVLTSCPQVLPFQDRVKIFQSLVEADKTSREGGANSAFHGFGGGNNTRLQIRRDNLFADAFSQVRSLDTADLKGRFQVEFFAAAGLAEAGIDGGGLFKEFIDSFIKEAFDTNFNLFEPTSSNLLVPSPVASSYYPEQHLEYFQFVGKILGKALYDCVLVESQFSVVFLNVLLGRINQFDDLRFLDEQTYKSLRQLKAMATAAGGGSSSSGDEIAGLDLYFVVERVDIEGRVQSEELIPGGANTQVTSKNIHTYLHRFANHKLNVQISQQCRAFLSGFRQLVSVDWMRLFSPRELQLVISGEERGVDIEDWKAHINYASGYNLDQPYIQSFWRVVESMSVEEQRNLLKFITSCSRQPLRGFSQLNPLICIQKVPLYSQDQFESETGALTARLPGAATCMNLLKLPEYDSEEVLKEKLLYAIMNNNMGFELS